jgi:SAM-dependent methyltransferase
MTKDARLMAPATARNREHITKVLRRYLPSHGLVLEVASGTGEHIVHFAGVLSADLRFQPSDADAAARASIDAWVESTGVRNVLPAIALDASADPWPIQRADAVVCINMIHIAPWEAAIGLVRGAAHLLPASGVLYLYGPYRHDGQQTSLSNETFDRGLRMQNPKWGVRDLDAVAKLADDHGFAQPLIEQMPANNLSLIFRRVASG